MRQGYNKAMWGILLKQARLFDICSQQERTFLELICGLGQTTFIS